MDGVTFKKRATDAGSSNEGIESGCEKKTTKKIGNSGPRPRWRKHTLVENTLLVQILDTFLGGLVEQLDTFLDGCLSLLPLQEMGRVRKLCGHSGCLALSPF